MRVNCLAENHYDLPVGGFAGGETDRWKRGAVALLEPRRHPATITVAQSTAMLVPATDATVTCSQGLDTGASPGVTELQYELTAGSLNDRVPATATPTIFGWLANLDSTTVPTAPDTLESETGYAGGVTGTSLGVTITVAN